jgi:hypothetical protein
MNAYELADRLTTPRSSGEEAMLVINHAIPMLRQQADRIAELESCLDFALQDTMDYLRLNNLGGENNHWLVWARKLLANTTPQTKPLSDGEIKELINNFPIIFSPQDLLTFARAIEERHGIK